MGDKEGCAFIDAMLHVPWRMRTRVALAAVASRRSEAASLAAPHLLR
jgi:hypothetical protein